MFKKLNKKGFTLAELLVVVAIIGVLVAISIPIFTSQLEKAREATDAANIRAAYAEVAAAQLTGATANEGSVKVTEASGAYTYTAEVKAHQKVEGWQGTDFSEAGNEIGGQSVTASLTGWTITASSSGNTITIAVKS